MECKAFDKILRTLSLQPDKAKTWLTDKRLTTLERKIIEGHLLLRDNKIQEILEKFKSLAPSPIAFVNGHKHFLLGLSFSHREDYQASIIHLKEAEAIFSNEGMDYYLFVAKVNHFFVLSNLGLTSEMEVILKELRMIPLDSDLSRHRLLRCEFVYAYESGDKKSAQTLLKDIHLVIDQFSESDFMSHLICEFMFHVQHDQFHEAERTLDVFKKQKKYLLKDSYKYMRKLLDHYLHNGPIYTLNGQFESIPVQFHEIKVIEAFEEVDMEKARYHWDALAKMMPERYQDGFKFQGLQCIFSVCLKKHLSDTQSSKGKQNLKSDGAKQEKLISILQNATAPLSKAHLYEMLWGEMPDTKDDLTKLTKMVSKIRGKLPFEIKTRKGTYQVIKNDLKSKKHSA